MYLTFIFKITGIKNLSGTSQKSLKRNIKHKGKTVLSPLIYTSLFSSNEVQSEVESLKLLQIKRTHTLISDGNSFSISSLPNLQPGGMISSLQRASRRVLSQTNEVYNSAKPLSTLSPNSEPQCVMDSVRISL
jgi:hypothetical protein